MSRDCRLNKQQRNEIFVAVQGCKLDPGDFFWLDKEVGELGKVSCLVHRPTGSCIVFGTRLTEWSVSCVASADVTNQMLNLNWKNRLDCFKVFASALKNEIETPDLWASIEQNKQFATDIAADPTNTNFTESERNHIALKIGELQESLIEQKHVLEGQVETLSQQMSYVVESSNRLGRKDWWNTLIGVMTNLFIGGVFAPDRAHQIMNMVVGVAAPLFHTVQTVAKQIGS